MTELEYVLAVFDSYKFYYRINKEERGYRFISAELPIDLDEIASYDSIIFFDEDDNATDVLVSLDGIYQDLLANESITVNITMDEFVRRIKQYTKDYHRPELLVDSFETERKYHCISVNLVENTKENNKNLPSMALYYCWLIKRALAIALNFDNKVDGRITPENIHKCVEQKLREKYKKKVLPAKILLTIGIIMPFLWFIIYLIVNNGSGDGRLLIGLPIGLAFIALAIVIFVKMKKYKKDIVTYRAKNPHIPLFRGSKSYYDDSDEDDIDSDSDEDDLVSGKSAEEYYTLGVNYENGENGVDKDFHKARYYFEKASELGHAAASCEAGLLYSGEQDWNKVKTYLLKAIEQDSKYSEAYLRLGILYKNGVLHDKDGDNNKALYYFEKAIELGNARAACEASSLYTDGLEGFEKDFEKAKSYYLKAIELDSKYSYAYYCLGCMYDHWDGMTKDINKTLYYFEKASELGYASASRELGLLYMLGFKGIKKDYKKAEKYLLKSIEQHLKDSETYYRLGLIYAYGGYGINKDISKAKEYLTKAANLGHQGAEQKLDKLG